MYFQEGFITSYLALIYHSVHTVIIMYLDTECNICGDNIMKCDTGCKMYSKLLSPIYILVCSSGVLNTQSIQSLPSTLKYTKPPLKDFHFLSQMFSITNFTIVFY